VLLVKQLDVLISVKQLSPISGPFEDFVRPSLGFHYSKTILPADNLSLFW